MLTTTVRVQEGELRGTESKPTASRKSIYSFTGIPYAKPPIGDLRFKAPVAIEKWDGVLDASKRDIFCCQVNKPRFGTSEPVGTEDCLYLNVYTPEAPCEIKEKKAVMIYIHGGGFCQGGSSTICPNFFLEQDVILVTFNYRLHVFGFLNAGTASCPGNAGLKDQLLAIQWVKRNITSFGGDVDNITLFGESAGAVSVHLHMLSPLSRGLYHRVILQSGNALSPWAIEDDPVLYARKLGRRAGYDEEDLEGLVQHLKDQSAAKLCELVEEIHIEDRINKPAFCANVKLIPSVEEIKDGAFLPEHPTKLMESAEPIPTVIGFNDQDGLLYYLAQEHEHMDLVIDDVSLIVKENFDLDESEQVELLAKMKQFYFRGETPTKDHLPEIINVYTDLYFMKFYEAIDHMVRSKIPPFVYVFAYNGNLNMFKRTYYEPYSNVDIKGAAHADEMAYLFDCGLPMDEADRKLSNEFCALWTNFAKNGRPTHTLPHLDWKPHTKSQPCHLRIESELKVLDERLFAKRFDFWKGWLAKFNR